MGAAATLLVALGLALGACTQPYPGDDEDGLAAEEVVEADPLPAGLEYAVTQHLAEYGRNWPAFRFHGAVLVARGDTVAVDRAFGQADLIEGVPNETSTVFRIGTLSAQLTAAAVLRLVEAGKLQLDDPVASVLPGWPGGDALTVRHLLTHRSGIPCFTDDITFSRWKNEAHDLQALVATFRDLPRGFEPGTDTEPSNSNYALLGLIVERVGGKPYAEVVAEHVLAPLGLEHTSYTAVPEGRDEVEAIGMTYNEGEYLDVVKRMHPSSFGPAGGWLSTTGDLLRLVQGLTRGDFLHRRHVAAMQGLLGDELGFGWAASEVAGRTVTSWPGLIDGFNGAVLYVPQDDTTILVLSNSEVIPAGQLVQDIAGMVYELPPPHREEPRAMPVPIETQAGAVGRYAITRGTEEALVGADPDVLAQLREVTIARSTEDALMLQVPGHGHKRMHPLGQGRFFFKDGPQTRAELIERPGAPAVLELQSGGTALRFVRVADRGAS